MGEITREKLELKSNIPISQVLDIDISHKVNEHAILTIRGYLQQNARKMEFRGVEGSEVRLIKFDKIGKEEILFIGLLERFDIFQEGKDTQVIFSAVSASILLDRKKKSRSFQRESMTYEEIIRKIVGEEGGVALISEGKDKTIEKPLIQYEETDWEFLKRLASHFHSYIVADSKSMNIQISFGMKEGEKEVELKKVLEIKIDGKYYEIGAEDFDIGKNNFLFYIIKESKNYEIGDKASIYGTGYQICEKIGKLEKGILEFTYLIGRKEGKATKISYNNQFVGLSLVGTIKNIKEEKVYLALEIDGEKAEPIYGYPWAPITGNIMYCMPKVGSKVMLYFANQDERSGQAINTIRENEKSCEELKKVQNRTLTTEYGKQLELFQNNIGLVGKEKLKIILEDRKEMIIESERNIELLSREKIRLEAPSIKIQTPQEINSFRTSLHISRIEKVLEEKEKKNPPTGGLDTSFGMNYEFNTLGAEGVLCGTEFEIYEAFQDAPEEIELQKSNLWGNFLAGMVAVAVLAAVAAVGTAYLASSVLTGGATLAGAPIVLGFLAGALSFIGGTTAVFTTKKNDEVSKTDSGVLKYIQAGASGAFVGGIIIPSILVVPSAAEVFVTSTVPIGLSIFGHIITTEVLTSALTVGGYITTYSNLILKVGSAIEAITGVNLIKSGIALGVEEDKAEEIYNNASEATGIISNAILLLGLCNPKVQNGIQEAKQRTNENISIKLPKTQYGQSKLQHEYKHAGDFGVTGNWNSSKALEYQEAIQHHIDTAPEVYKSTYRGNDVYVYLNQETSLGAYVDMNGNYVGGWKFTINQINYHLQNGTKIK